MKSQQPLRNEPRVPSWLELPVLPLSYNNQITINPSVKPSICILHTCSSLCIPSKLVVYIYMSGSVLHRLQVKTDNQAVTLLYRALYQFTSNYHPTTIPEMFCSRRNKLEPPKCIIVSSTPQTPTLETPHVVMVSYSVKVTEAN